MKKFINTITVVVAILLFSVVLLVIVNILSTNKIKISNNKFESFSNVDTDVAVDEDVVSAEVVETTINETTAEIYDKPEEVIGKSDNITVEFNDVSILFNFTDNLYYDDVVANIKNYIIGTDKVSGSIIVNEYYTDADSLVIPIVDDGRELDIRVGLNSLAEKRDLMN